MTASEARVHLSYSAWASGKLLDAIRAISAEDAERDVKVSHRSLLQTLAHIQMADWVWYTRAVGPMERPGDALAVLEAAWPDLQRKWIQWAAALQDADLLQVVEYRSLDGSGPFRTPLWQIVLHVVNHATLHRGQAMAMLRQLGHKPPSTDLIFYYRELEKAV